MSSTQHHQPSPITQAAPRRFGVGRILAMALGALLTLTGVGSLLGAGVLGWANATQRDSQGYFSTSTQRFSTFPYAITSDHLDLNSGVAPSDWFAKNDNVANVRIRAKKKSTVFIGIAPQTDVDRFLSWVAQTT